MSTTRTWRRSAEAKRLAAAVSPKQDENGQGLRIAIVGAGPSGFFCADRIAELAQQGQAHLEGKVHLFRSRSKMSATQMETEHNTIYPRQGKPFFDYGCQYITAGDEWFRNKMEKYEKLGICHRWPVGVLSQEHGYESLEPAPGWAGREGMWKLQEEVVANILRERHEVLELHSSVAKWPPSPGQKFPDQSPLVCESFEKNPDGSWTLWNNNSESFGPFDVLVGCFVSHNHTNVQLSTPATRRMRDYFHSNLRFSPVITAMVIFEHPLELNFNAAFVVGDTRLAWVSRNNAKVAPGVAFEADGRDFYTFLAPAQYSTESFEKDARGYKRRALEDFMAAFGELVGKNLWRHKPRMVRALHWEAGLPCTTLPTDAGYVFDEEQNLGWCGHWALFGGVEGAALSGKNMAEMLASKSRGEPIPADAGYQIGEWPDIGCRVRPGYVRLGHGFFYIQHPRLQSIAPPLANLSSEDTARFWSKLGAWGYGGDARSQGQDPNGTRTSGRDSKGKGKGKSKGRRKDDAWDYGHQTWYAPKTEAAAVSRRWHNAIGA